MAYVEDSVLKDYFRDEKVAADNVHRASAAAAAEQTINTWTGRNFAVATTASNRTFYRKNVYGCHLTINDCTSITSVTVNGSLLAPSSYRGETDDSYPGEGRPIVRILRDTDWCLWAFTDNVIVNAAWGWAATPASIVEATKILARDIASNRDVINGIATVTEAGAASARKNAVVMDVINRYKTTWGIA